MDLFGGEPSEYVENLPGSDGKYRRWKELWMDSGRPDSRLRGFLHGWPTASDPSVKSYF